MLKFISVFAVTCAFASMSLCGPNPANAAQFSSWSEACTAAEKVVQNGDIIFLDSPDFLFRKVAASTGSWTSHVGIVFKNSDGRWEVYESTIPLSKKGPLCDYLKSSAEYRFEIKRLSQGLSSYEVDVMRAKAEEMLQRFYTVGFNFDSRFLYCSKFVHLVYGSVGITVGELQTFQELLNEKSESTVKFWRWWFFGKIPWQRRTVTPASQLNDSKFRSVLVGDSTSAMHGR